jgi:3-hydroxyisobutyrate dehydrogenase-like beta-hydroxyacid dehydrogenase
MQQISSVGILGLGKMGLPMGRHLLKAGFTVCGYDRHASKLTAFSDVGGIAQPSAGAVAAQSEAVLIMVVDDAQVKDVTVGHDGVLKTAKPGTVLIISSTVKPSTCREVAAAAETRGVMVLDAPVARGQRAAEEGTLTVFVSGERPLFERCRPIFQAFGKEIFHIDEHVGSGQVAKLVNNLILRAGIVAVHESLALAERLGVSPARLRTALEHGSADSYALRELHLINLTWQHKDLEQALEVAAEAGIELPLANCVGALIRMLTREELHRLARSGQDTTRNRTE